MIDLGKTFSSWSSNLYVLLHRSTIRWWLPGHLGSSAVAPGLECNVGWKSLSRPSPWKPPASDPLLIPAP